MIDDSQTFQSIRQRLYGETLTIDELRGLLAQAEQLRKEPGAFTPEQVHLLDELYMALAKATRDDLAQGQEIILKHLLPLLLEDYHEAEGNLHLAFSQCRRTLVSWITEYSFPERANVRERVLEQLLLGLQSAHPTSACWTIGDIGYRWDPVVTELRKIIDSPTVPLESPDVTDTALVTLVELGVPEAERAHMQALLEEQMRLSHRMTLMRAVQQLADPTSLAFVEAYWLFPAQPDTVAPFQQQVAMSLLTAIADAHVANESLQDQVWTQIETACTRAPEPFLLAVYLGGAIVQRCNSPLVIPTLLRWLSQEGGTEEAPSYHRYLLYNRIKECVRPRHLQRPSEPLDVAPLLPILRADACADTGRVILFATQEGRLKKLAWETLLFLGRSEIADWLEAGIVEETNPYLRQELCKLLANFRFSSLPHQIEQWVMEEYDASSAEDNGRLQTMMGATELIWSAASLRAFEVLCSFGYTYRGAPLQQTVDALADVALIVARAEGPNAVIPRLVELALHGKSRHQGAALAALERLAGEGLVSTPEALKLEAVIDDTLRPSFERSKGATVWGFLAEEDWTPYIEQKLIRWATEDKEWLGGRALEALARHHRLLTLLPQFSNRLGLSWNEDHWERVPESTPNRWNTYLIGLLYRDHPDLFASAIGACLEPPTRPVQSVEDRGGILLLAEVLIEGLKGDLQRTLSPELTQAFLRRAAWGQTSFSSDAEMLEIVALLNTPALAQYPWEQHWHRWIPDARAALADTLGNCAFAPDDADTRDRAVSLLMQLTSDGRYEVRRSAYRALAALAPYTLLTLCLSWEQASTHLRERAAEAIAWVPAQEELLALSEPLFRHLASDEEPSVRAAAARSEKEGRERQWSAAYLDQIVQLGTGSNQTSQDTLAAWRYGQALTHVGDDASLRRLRAHLRQQEALLPHTRAWFVWVINGIKERWEKVTREWPEPWAYWEGRMEAGTGALLLPGRSPMRVRYALWLDLTKTVDGPSSWGGTLWSQEAGLEQDVLEPGRVGILELADQRQGNIILAQTQIPQQICRFKGQGPYPDHLQS